jgi:hypothetical protein
LDNQYIINPLSLHAILIFSFCFVTFRFGNKFVSFRFVSFHLISFRFFRVCVVSFRFYFVSHFTSTLELTDEQIIWTDECVRNDILFVCVRIGGALDIRSIKAFVTGSSHCSSDSSPIEYLPIQEAKLLLTLSSESEFANLLIFMAIGETKRRKPERSETKSNETKQNETKRICFQNEM